MTVFALILAIVAGFAAQRGSICAVAAVRELVIDRKAQRYVAFFECAAWSLALLTAARAFGISPSAAPQDYAPGLIVAFGGALFGAGAFLNGACTFGSAARLGRGEVAFAAMPAGFVLGVMMAAQLAQAPSPRALTGDPASSDIAVMGLVFFVGFQLFRLSDAVSGPRDAIARLAEPVWRPSLAMGVIGLTSALLMIFFAPWPYSKLLTDLGVSAGSDQALLKIALAIAFVVGAAIGAHTRGVFKFVAPSPRDAAEKAAAGALMGAGSYFAQGGNDSMVLVGLPHFFVYAVIAYLSMTATIAAIVFVAVRPR
ncbi:MAG: hypothetical protein A3E78_08575 [Alphaproteobacteria bacterium RIFCSPHIGHO2_12_FULL_63_12]|nr:MAG: hypothetical protein A3E78_08575 [Alphaproteobacteria bacterium RIFCSPHIGHO2_12_FULL_63_12]